MDTTPQLDLARAVREGFTGFHRQLETLFAPALIYGLVMLLNIILLGGVNRLANLLLFKLNAGVTGHILLNILGPLLLLAATSLLVGPITYGYLRCVWQAFAGDTPDLAAFGDGFRRLAQTYLLVLVPGLAIMVVLQLVSAPITAFSAANTPLVYLLLALVNLLTTVVLGALVGSLFLFAMPDYSVRQTSFGEALNVSFRLLLQHPIPVIALAFLLTLLNSLGTLILCIGIVYTAPLAGAISMAAYRQLIEETAPAED